MPTDSEAIVARTLAAFNERRWSDFAAEYTPVGVISYPQSGERFAGRENIQGMVEAFPSPPTFAVRAMHASGDLVVAEVDIDYGGGSVWKGAFLYAVQGGKIVAETAYFGAPFEAASWRAPFREA